MNSDSCSQEVNDLQWTKILRTGVFFTNDFDSF